MTLRVFEAFAGVGSQRMALRNLGIDHEIVAIAEIDKFAIKSYEAIHGETNNLGDISQIETADIPDHDLFTYSFPCFTKDNLVLTEEGHKPINEVAVGDKVLTHNNTYEKVVKTFDNGIQPTVKVKSMGIDEIVTTPNHKFYVREKYREWNNDRRSYDRLFKEPQWKEIKDVTKDYYLGMAVNQKSEIPKWNGITFRWADGRKPRHKNELQDLMDGQDFWWIVGRYLADGWTRTQGGIVFGIGKDKISEFEDRIGKLFNYSTAEEKSVVKYHVPLKELSKFVEQFGKGAANKKLSKSVLNLPIDLLESFLEGYFSGDGSFVNGYWKANSVSRELMLGIGQAVMKVYKRPYSLHKDIRPKTAVIEGRTVNQKDSYSLSFKKEAKKQDNAFYEGGYVWIPFNTIEDAGNENVYDIEVNNAHSFTVQNVIVHNCQDISVAGKGLGLDEGSDTRSGLLWECQKVIAVKKPKYLLLENVKNLVGKKHKHNFNKWLEWLEELGYMNYWKILNAKDYGIPQNRERVFVVSILGEHEPYEFPEPVELELRLKDVLESEVDEKFYLSQKIQDRLTMNINFKNEIKTIGSTKGKENTRLGQRDIVYSEEGIMGALCATDYKQPKQVLDGKIKQIGQYDTANRKNKSAYRVYDSQGISPTLSTMQGGGRQPSVVVAKEEYGRLGRQAVETLNDNDVKHSDTVNPFGKRVSSKNGISPTLTARPEGFKTAVLAVVDSIELPAIGASRGRNPENPSDSTAGSPTEQRLEINKHGTSNTITTVQKDNYVIEPLGTLAAHNSDKFGSGYMDGVSKTLKANKHDISVVERVTESTDSTHFLIGSTQKNAGITDGDCSTTLTSAMGAGGGHVPMHNVTSDLRIRKLTPKECWRLMGFSDDDFHKAEEVNSNTQLYKQAGNSIVVDVLEAIFKQLLED